ncbi:DsbA family oxidoreductase [Burkholderia guangdongensis]|uniref:DsbA family oxidoreductase n=1 Tax=Burkholderia guangdongensis TaxID=1792500 RepID=UPI0015CDE8EA|nr:DsbA family oxidoreductase [Burkholderia guangdongensis]
MSTVPLRPTTTAATIAGPHAAPTIDVLFDFVCPWCLIGKRQLDRALRRLATADRDVRPVVAWHGVQLLPDTPRAGVDYQAFYVARLGSPAAVAARREQVRTVARSAGLELAFERIRVLPNTALAHRVAAYAASAGADGLQAALIDRIFSAYFIDGDDIGDPAVLERLAVACGLPADGVRAVLGADANGANGASGASGARIAPPAALRASNGVPTFVFDGAETLSGAVPPDVLVAAACRALVRREAA